MLSEYDKTICLKGRRKGKIEERKKREREGGKERDIDRDRQTA